MPTINATANLAVSTDAVSSTSLAANDAAGATLSVGNSVVVAEVQREAFAANLAPSITVRSHATQQFELMNTTLAAQDDAIEVLGYLIAVMAGSRCSTKSGTEEMIDQIVEIATQALEELYGYRTMPLHRPDSDQFNELVRATNAARASAGLDPLPILNQ